MIIDQMEANICLDRHGLLQAISEEKKLFISQLFRTDIVHCKSFNVVLKRCLVTQSTNEVYNTKHYISYKPSDFI